MACAEPQVAVKRAFDFSSIRRVAVADFSGPGGDAAADHLVQALLADGADVVERRRLDSLLKEANLGAGGYLDAGTVREMGRILGVDAVFTGSVTAFSPARSYLVFPESAVEPALLGSPSVVSRGPAAGVPGSDVITSAATVGMTARMVDVETGSVLWSAHLSYEGIDVDSAMMRICRSFVRSLIPLWLGKRS